jgi:diaminobutyrate-2-oxoglutarate transaminase
MTSTWTGSPQAAALEDPSGAEVFELHEAQVRSYCRLFGRVFATARGALMIDVDGRTYVDFFTGAGALNYGHNHPQIKKRLIEYLDGDGIMHSLDLYTAAKRDFIATLYDIVLEPRGLGDYRITFPGPTGTNAVETSLKIARKATGRETVVAFTNAFHGMSLGSLALTAARDKRRAAGTALPGVARLPFDGYLGEGVDTARYLEKLLDDPWSGVDTPAAIVVETVQAEGGLNVASTEWLREVARIARLHGALLIVDDIQTGCGRTGTFFSFEGMGIEPDVVLLSKSLGAIGLPLSLVVFRPELDVLQPGEHNGTFRGNNLGFVAATAALELWRDTALTAKIARVAKTLRSRLERIVTDHPGHGAQVRGRGALLGLVWTAPEIASRVSAAAFERGAIAETCGPRNEVLKLMPPLVIDDDELERGLDAVEQAVSFVVRG